jgi:hypothetical protein
VVPERDVSAAVQAEESLLEADALTVTARTQGPLLALLLCYALQLETDFPALFFFSILFDSGNEQLSQICLR